MKIVVITLYGACKDSYYNPHAGLSLKTITNKISSLFRASLVYASTAGHSTRVPHMIIMFTKVTGLCFTLSIDQPVTNAVSSILMGRE